MFLQRPLMAHLSVGGSAMVRESTPGKALGGRLARGRKLADEVSHAVDPSQAKNR
jgi:hypothetical protein